MYQSLRIAALAAAATLISPLAAAADLSHADQKYVDQTAQGLMAEIQLGEMAERRAADDQVKQFGRRMIKDHGQDLDNLKHLAAQRNIKLPVAPDHSQRKEADKLAHLSGAAFDREYVNYEVKDHKKDVEEQGKEMNGTADPDLKKFATAAYRTVSEHRQIVDHLQTTIAR